MLKRIESLWFWAALFVLCVQSSVVSASTFTFIRLVDTNDPLPGAMGNFQVFDRPSLDGSTLGFRHAPSATRGIFAMDVGGIVRVVADKFTTVPGSTATFTNFGGAPPSVDGGEIAFGAFDSGGGLGIYLESGSLSLIADQTTPRPGAGGGTFSILEWPSVEAGTVLFTDRGIGVYSSVGTSISVVVDTSDTVPASTSTFGWIGPPSFSGDEVSFKADSPEGIYVATLDGATRVVADQNTPIPNGVGNFAAFGGNLAVIDGGDVVFKGGDGASQDGIYAEIQGSLRAIADVNTAIPGGTGNFTVFGISTIDDGATAFRALGASSQEGIYTDLGGALEKVIQVGDALDGKVVSALDLGEEGLSGNRIAFRAGFQDGSQGLYVAEIQLARSLTCTGFEPPLHQTVTVRKHRALPLKAQLFEENGALVEDVHLDAPPVAQVLFSATAGGEAVDVTDLALPAGQSSQGNEFFYDEAAQAWHFNLDTRNYTAAGTYTITARSGDETAYVITPSCQAVFIKN